MKREPRYKAWSNDKLEFELSRCIVDIGASTRVIELLEQHGIFTIRQLLLKTKRDLLNIRNLGQKSLNEIIDGLDKMGFEQD